MAPDTLEGTPPVKVEDFAADPPKKENKGRKVLLVFVTVMGATGVVFGGLTKLIDELDLDTPMARWVQIGVLLTGVLATVVGLVKVLSNSSARAATFVLLAMIVVLVAGSAALLLTDDGHTIRDGETVSSTLDPDGERTHHFTVANGDRAILMLEEGTNFDAELTVENGNQVYEAVPDQSGRRWWVDQTLAAGTWDAVVRSARQTGGAYTLRLVIDEGSAINLGDEFENETLHDAVDSTGYTLNVPERQRVTIAVDHFSSSFVPALQVRVGGFIRGQTEAVDGQAIVTIDAQPRTQYLIVVRGTNRTFGGYRIRALAEAPHGNPSTPTTVITGLSGGSQPMVAVPNVYGLAQREAEQRLVSAGFAVRSFPVCSASVGPGIVRQVFRSGGPETVVVDQPAVVVQTSAPNGSELSMKIGTGKPCREALG